MSGSGIDAAVDSKSTTSFMELPFERCVIPSGIRTWHTTGASCSETGGARRGPHSEARAVSIANRASM